MRVPPIRETTLCFEHTSAYPRQRNGKTLRLNSKNGEEQM